MKKLKFEELNLSEQVMRAITEMGFEEASPIQSESIPLLMQGRDLIGHAQTGTGKTAAFAIPIIEKMDLECKDIQAVVLCPTRELVIQVTEEFRRILKYKYNIGVVPIYGGQEIDRQINALRKKPHVVIGTPGRMMDHMRRATIKMDHVKVVVLDEADEMLDMGFREDMEVILKDTPASRQTIMFSATMPEDITKLMKQYQKNPARVDVTNQKMHGPKIEQVYFDIQEKAKPEALARLIDFHNIKLGLVFCNTKVRVDEIVEELKTRGYSAEGLHGDMNQAQRNKVMSGFKNGLIEILVATDVAGRGIDVNNIEAVFNYDLPRDDEDYIHRIGRTARAGKSGKSFTFIVGRQIYNLRRIEIANGTKIVSRHVPSLDELDETRIKTYREKVKKILEKGQLSKFVSLIENIMGEEYNSIDVAAAMFKLLLDGKSENTDKNKASDPNKIKIFTDFQKEAIERAPDREFSGRERAPRDYAKKRPFMSKFKRTEKEGGSNEPWKSKNSDGKKPAFGRDAKPPYQSRAEKTEHKAPEVSGDKPKTTFEGNYKKRDSAKKPSYFDKFHKDNKKK